MPPEHPAPGTDTAAVAARVEEAGAPPSPSTAPTAPTQPSAPATGAQSATAPAGEAAVAPSESSATAKPAEAPEARAEDHGVAAAVGTTPETRTATAVDKGRPRTPILAGAAFVGAALVAIPVLLMGSANDEGPRTPATTPVAGSADTVLNPESAPAALDDYVAVKPTPSPTKGKKTAPAKAVPAPAAPAPVAPTSAAPTPTPEPRPSAPAAKPKASPEPKPKPKPKAAPKPNWGTQAVSATSSIGVGQSWATNRIRMTMQQDGNLVVYNERNKPIWAAMTFGKNHRAIFQPDGNLVIHNGDDRAIWASKTHDFGGARMVLRPDAKVVIVHNGRVVWST
ncbi:mannose-binding protein [Streptomyces pratensis]|uniref:mannose-binding protein n=1 Tax=Streptomyces pratensis TaxID=1169025 RepID=UPI00301A48D7